VAVVSREAILPYLGDTSAESERLRRYMREQDRERRRAWDSESQLATNKTGVTSVLVGTSDTVLYHQLGRAPVEWIATSLNVDTRVWSPARDATTITMRASTPCVTRVRVF
jgi:hypothetical protein